MLVLSPVHRMRPSRRILRWKVPQGVNTSERRGRISRGQVQRALLEVYKSTSLKGVTYAFVKGTSTPGSIHVNAIIDPRVQGFAGHAVTGQGPAKAIDQSTKPSILTPCILLRRYPIPHYLSDTFLHPSLYHRSHTALLISPCICPLASLHFFRE